MYTRRDNIYVVNRKSVIQKKKKNERKNPEAGGYGDVHISRLTLSFFPVSRYCLSRYSCALSAAAPTDNIPEIGVMAVRTLDRCMTYCQEVDL
jgi:hypothetical protein